MSNDKTEPFTIPAVLAFPSLFQPSKPRDSEGDPKFNSAIVVTAEVYAQHIKPKVDALIAANFSAQDCANPRFNWGFLPCTTKPTTYPAELTPGMWYGNAKSQFKTDTVDQSMQPIVDPNVIRDGAIVNISINLYTFNKAGNVGLGVGLGPVMYMGDGTALNVGGGIGASEAFAGVAVDPSMAPAPVAPVAGQPAPAAPMAAAPAAPAAPMAPAPAAMAPAGAPPVAGQAVPAPAAPAPAGVPVPPVAPQ